jgi:hypothetical protein
MSGPLFIPDLFSRILVGSGNLSLPFLVLYWRTVCPRSRLVYNILKREIWKAVDQCCASVSPQHVPSAVLNGYGEVLTFVLKSQMFSALEPGNHLSLGICYELREPARMQSNRTEVPRAFIGNCGIVELKETVMNNLPVKVGTPGGDGSDEEYRPYCLHVRCHDDRDLIAPRNANGHRFRCSLKLKDVIIQFSLYRYPDEPKVILADLDPSPSGRCNFYIRVLKDSDGQSLRKALGLLLSVLRVRHINPADIAEYGEIDPFFGVNVGGFREWLGWLEYLVPLTWPRGTVNIELASAPFLIQQHRWTEPLAGDIEARTITKYSNAPANYAATKSWLEGQGLRRAVQAFALVTGLSCSVWDYDGLCRNQQSLYMRFRPINSAMFRDRDN